MLTYTPSKPSSQSMNKKRSWLWLLLVFVWLWPGVLHHDLWTPGEPYLFTTASQWHKAHWAVPTIFGEINWEASPLYIWLSALCQHLFSPNQMDAFEATRLTNVILIVCSFACIGGSGRQFLGRGYGRITILILLGCTGILIPAHFINDSIILFLGSAMCWYGFSLSDRRIMMACMMLGGGWAVLSLTGSLLWPLLLMLVAFSLLFYPQWRRRRYYLVLLISLLCALPLMIVWPLALHQTAANIFNLWWQYHALAPFGGFQHQEVHFSLGYYLKNLLWFAFPAWPLAIWTATRGKLKKQRWGVLAIVWLSLCLPVFALLPLQYQDLLVIVLPPMALLGAAQLDALRRGAIAFLNWFGIMAFGFLALFLWLGFIAMNYGWPAKLAARAVYFSPYYRYDVNYFPLIVACVLTPLWLWAITRQHIRGRQAVTNWAAGVLLVWSLLLTLFLPWLDAAKSARPVVQQMENSLSKQQLQAFSDRHACISINHDNFSTRIAWQQYSWIPLQADNPECEYRLVTRDPKAEPPQPWHEIWSGARPREKNNIIALWAKTTATKEK